MPSIAGQLSDDLAEVVGRARRSLVAIQGVQGGKGSGIILHPEGLIATNAHVVRQSRLQVSMPNGSTCAARVLALDEAGDLAALVVGASGLPAIELGHSGALRPGQWVAALGHPWGLEGAATSGVVIGVGSDLPEIASSGRAWVAVALRLRPGNSGGPLVDAAGRLVGINTMMTGPSIGMAVPTEALRSFLRRYLGTREGVATL